jgi:type I restriction enzyme R subunit
MAEKDLRENPFRDEIYDYLLTHGYKESKKSDYDFENALDRAKLFDFLEATQSKELNKLKATYGNNYQDRFVKLLCDKINSRGLLAALNEKVEDYVSNTAISLAFYKSNLEEMTEGNALYEKNIFSVCRL